jgi:hypothetical protein
MNEHFTDVKLPTFADPQQTRLTSWGGLTRHKPEPGRELPAVLEVRRITDRRDESRRGSWANAWNRQEALADRMRLTDGFQLLIV